MDRITIVADDVTGACDAGIKLLAPGREVEVFIDSDRSSLKTSAAQVISLSTNTRSALPWKAAQKLRRFFDGQASDDLGLIYKKIDSMFRGNVGVELVATMEALEKKAALVVPSIPENGRSVKDGRLFAELAGRAQRELDIIEALRRSTPLMVDGISLTTVRLGADALAETIGRRIEKGCQILVVDAETQTDLDLIAEAARKYKGPLLLSGSAGLAKSLWGHQSAGMQAEVGKREGLPRHRTLAVIGSASPVTVQQVNALKQMGGVSFFTLVADFDARLEKSEEQIASLRKRLTEDRAETKVLTMKQVLHGNAVGIEKELSDLDIVHALSEIALGAVEQGQVEAMLLSGGETAEGFLKAAGVDRLQLREEPFPGLVMAHCQTASGRTVKIVTKSGSFGGERALIEILDYLKNC